MNLRILELIKELKEQTGACWNDSDGVHAYPLDSKKSESVEEMWKELIEIVKTHGSITKSELFGHMGWGRGIKWTPYRSALMSHPNIFDSTTSEPTYIWKET